MTPPPMQFSFGVLVVSIVTVLVLVAMDWFKERRRSKTGPKSVSWFTSSCVAYGAAILPLINIPFAISRADVTDQFSTELEAGWGLGTTVAVWAVLLAIPAVRRWLLEPKDAMIELERKSAA